MKQGLETMQSRCQLLPHTVSNFIWFQIPRTSEMPAIFQKQPPKPSRSLWFWIKKNYMAEIEERLHFKFYDTKGSLMGIAQV